MSSIFITGGAAGIGLATAERFDRDGWTIGVYDVDTDALAKVKADHPDWITGTLDVREPEQWADALAEFTSHTGGTLDVLAPASCTRAGSTPSRPSRSSGRSTSTHSVSPWAHRLPTRT